MISVSAMFLALFTFGLGLLSNLFLDEWRRLRSIARFKPSFQKGHIPETRTKGFEEREYPSKYVRVAVTNMSPFTANDCRAYLMKIKKKDISGFKEVDFFNDAMRLRWAYEPERPEIHKGIQITNSVPFYIDIFSLKDESKDIKGKENPNRGLLRIIQVAEHDFRFSRFQGKIEFNSTYMFEVKVVAENAMPLYFEIEVKMGSKEDWRSTEIQDIRIIPTDDARAWYPWWYKIVS